MLAFGSSVAPMAVAVVPPSVPQLSPPVSTRPSGPSANTVTAGVRLLILSPCSPVLLNQGIKRPFHRGRPRPRKTDKYFKLQFTIEES